MSRLGLQRMTLESEIPSDGDGQMRLGLQDSCRTNFPGGPGCCNITKMVAKLIFLEDLSTWTLDSVLIKMWITLFVLY
jgi:hypothetical protein